MNQIKILSQYEKAKIVKQLDKQFGIKKVEGILTMTGREKLFLFQGSLDEEQIKNIGKNVLMEKVGIYFAKRIDNEIKLNIEGVEILKEQITKNIFELNEEQAEQWMKGNELLVQDFNSSQKKAGGWSERFRENIEGGWRGGRWKEKNIRAKSRVSGEGKKEFLIMKYNNDFLGCGKASENKITNFIPKNRRLK
jgi:NOL1/NOP2/fmu family ribosome biogenesis protein